MPLMSDKYSKKGGNFDSSGSTGPKGAKPKKGVVEANVFSYYQRCNQILNKEKEFENESEKIAFLKTTFETLAVDGFKVLQNQTLSRVIESFLDFADFEILNTVLHMFAKNWETSATDRFAHRVLQKTLEVYQSCLNASSESVERGEPPKYMTEVVTKISDFAHHMYENYPNYMEHQQASYILRTYLKVLSGIKVKVVGADEEVELVIPGMSNYEFVLMDLSKNILRSANLKDVICQPLPNLFVQTILTCLRYRFPNEARKIVKFLLQSDLFKPDDTSEQNDSNESIPSIFMHPQGCYFMERLVRLMSKKSFKVFVENFISGKEDALALNSCASFVLQRVLERAEEAQFLALIRPLSRRMPDIFAEGQFGLMRAIGKAAEQFPDAQKRFVSALRKTLRCNSEDPAAQAAFLTCLVRMRELGAEEKLEEGEEEGGAKNNELNHHGCLLAQSLFRFKKTGFLVRSVIASSPEYLLRIGTDKSGNHVFDALFASPSVPDEFKVQIMERMAGILVTLSCDKYGSRVMDCLWKHLDASDRATLVEKLMPDKNKIRNDRFGRFICQNFGLMVYHRKREWEKMQARSCSKPDSAVVEKRPK